MKKIKKIKLSILLIVLFTGINVWAQRPEESQSLISKVVANNDLYNGTANVNIPLFEIPVGNLMLSNDISNSAKGLRPRADESIYGLHWYANQFGSITREAHKDFLLTKDAVVQTDTGVAGIYPSQARKARETVDCIIQKQNLNFTASKKQILQNPNGSGAQSESGYIPDKFYFDFFGYKGYFVFDNNGKALVYCESAKLKVLETDSPASKCYSVTSPIDFQNKNISEIRMMDDKGNTFYFGGSFDALEVNYSKFYFGGMYYNPVFQSDVHFDSGSRANYILSWFLKKVELSNGETILANYKQGDSNIFNSFTQSSLFNLNGSGFPTDYPPPSELTTANIETSYSREISSSTVERMIFTESKTKRSILQNIEVVGKNIHINYNYFKDNNSLIHLSNINLNYFGKSENIIFNQTPLGGTNSRYFLTSLNNNGEIYFFEYDKTDNLPSKRNNYATNYFGFWNGTTSTTGAGNSNDFYNATLLKKVIYPSQGYTIFNNEKADVSKKGNTDYTLTSMDGAISRLANKVDFDGEKEYKINYTYRLGNGISSGILDYIVIPGGNAGDYNIRYSQVQETVLNKGTVEYFYSDVISNPDDASIKKFSINSNPATNYLYFNDDNNREYQRGKLIKKKVFDFNNNLLKESTYEYESFLRPESELTDLTQNNCTTCKISDENYYVLTAIDRSFSVDYAATRYEPVIPYLLKKEKVTDYINGKTISSETNIKYRESNKYWHPYPEQIETTTTSGTSIKKILYAHDLYLNGCTSCVANENIVGGQYPTYTSMVNTNIMFPIIEIVKNENNKYSLQENLFYTPPFVQKKNRFSKLGTTLDFINYNINIDKTVDNITYDLLDDKANYLQTTNKSAIPTVIIYGYKQTYPIAKIVGVTYVQLMQILGQATTPTAYLNLDIVTKSNADTDVTSEQALISELEIFRNNIALKDYSITTYTYDPLIGVTSITPPSGIREFYVYDSNKRLKEIRENNATGNILKEYNYHYAPRKFYSKAVNKSFTKNDCPAGMISSSVTYSVPEAKYMSIIDQADADQQAENEGQNYANSSLTCYYPYCTFNAQASSLYINIQYAPFQKINNVVNAQLNFMVSSNQGVNWSDVVQLGNIPSPCQPTTTATATSGNWQVTILPGSGQTVLRWLGSGSPATGTPYNITFNYNVN